MEDDKPPKPRSAPHWDENFVPTEQDRALVTQLIIAGRVPKQIAKIMGISVRALRCHFKSELQKALAMAVVAASAGLQKILRGLDGAKPNVQLRAIELFLNQRGGEAWQKKAPLKAVGSTGESDKEQRKENSAKLPVVKWTLNPGGPTRKK